MFSVRPDQDLREHFSPRDLAEDSEGRFLRLLSLPRFFSPLLQLVAGACAVRRVRLDATALRAEARAAGSMGDAGEGIASAVADLRGMDNKPKKGFLPVLEALQEVFPRVEDVIPSRYGPGRLALTFRERGVTGDFDQSSVSDGVLHALALLLGLAAPTRRGGAGILAIEEPENAIHPWSIRVLMRRMQGAPRRQIVLTTHSVEVVNGVKDPDSLLVVEVGDDGTRIVPASEKEEALRAILRDTGEGLGEVWKGGTLGGVPAEPA
jgi:hypothetical protein